MLLCIYSYGYFGTAYLVNVNALLGGQYIRFGGLLTKAFQHFVNTFHEWTACSLSGKKKTAAYMI